jgi:arylsulfatase A-like enzyme
MQCYSRVVGSSIRNAIAASALCAVAAFGAAGPKPERWPPPRVIVIGVDGLSVDGVVRAQTPQMHRLMRRAAWTLAARGVMPTLSSPNWESMITGAGTEQHGITNNGWFRRMVEFKPVCHGPDGKFPTIFDALHTERPGAGIAIFHDWRGFANLVARESADVLEHDNGPERTTEAATQYWRRERPALLFIHLDNVDHAGHDHGWGSTAYYAAVAEADRLIGEVISMLDDESAWDSTYVLVTSDHGGTPHGHGKNSLEEIQIPWILAGPSVAPGEIAGLVNTFDTAATLAWIFGLGPMRCAIGRPVMAAFETQPDAAPAATLTGARRCEPDAPRQPVPAVALHTVQTGQ